MITDTTWVGLKLERARPIPPQICAQVRSLILAGELSPGTKIPSTHELAALWGIRAPTVHGGLAPLVGEGLLLRHRGIGTFIRKPEKKLRCAGIYVGGAHAESQFQQALAEALKEDLHRRGIEPDIWIDPRPDGQQPEPWMPLVRAAEHREFQALIMVNAGLPQLRWLRKLPVPLSVFGGVPDMPGRVTLDYPQIADLGLRVLAAQGCRAAGLILPASPSSGVVVRGRSVWLDLCERFLERAGELGVTVRNEWMRLSRRLEALQGTRAQEQYGYEEFLKLWRRPERPAGLVVYPDTVARGVMLALREKHVRVPADLKLVLHQNEAVGLFCPMPATFLVLSERAIARALVGQVQKQFRGENCDPMTISFDLVSNESGNQQPARKGRKEAAS